MNTEQERAAFEAWCREKYSHPNMERNSDGYISTATHHCVPMTYASVQMLWEAWKARAALQSQDREDALRYRTLVASGKFVPATLSSSCLWGLRTSGTKATKSELDEAIDHARRIEGDV